MSGKEKVVRVTIRIQQTTNGEWVIAYCKDEWRTMPFRWPTEASARHDLALIVETLLKRGYAVVNPSESEVKTV